MKEAFELIKARLEPESDFFGGKAMGTLQKMYYCKGVEKALSIVSEVEAEYINKSTEHINKSSDCSSNWIPCSERLPEEEGHYLTTADLFNEEDFDIEELLFENGLWLVDEGVKEWEPQGPVLAWMPKPETYKPEKGV